MNTPHLSNNNPLTNALQICLQFSCVCFVTDAIDFHESVKVGHIVNLVGLITFTSSRSIEIKVVVDAEDLVTGMYHVCYDSV